MAKKSTSAKKKPAKKSSKNKSLNNWPWKKLFKFSFKWGMVAALWCTLIIIGILLYYGSELPNITKSMVLERRPTISIQASNGEVVDRYGDIKGEIVDVRTLPPHITNAILATEDRKFYSHWGIDIKGIIRAFTVNLAKGRFAQGGSTITQQLAKNLFLSRERTLKRKIQEVILSFQLERELDKDEILSAYLNRVYLGSGAYGIDAAARTYFGKTAEELDLREAAVIAGLLKAPSRYSPNSNPELSEKRTAVVMQAMADAGYITEDDINEYKEIPPAPKRKPSSGDSVRYFTDYIVSQLDDLIGNIEEDIIVTTTLDIHVQKELEETITKALLRHGPKSDVGQAAGLFMRNDGAVVALMGGKNYENSEYNRVSDAIRQPGSAFKPFVYLAALENGKTMFSQVEDKKITTGRYKPKNFGNKYYGWVTLEKALTNSLNTIAVNLMREVGVSNVINTARRLGVTADLEPNLSTALGSSGVPMTQMVTAYSTLARGGLAVDAYSIKKIKTKSGEILYEYSAPKKPRQVIEIEPLSQINAMMRSVVEKGTGVGAKTSFPAAGKTGTTQDYRDAWFVGFTERYTGAIWLGNDDNSPMKRISGGSVPASIWKQVMIKAQSRGGKVYDSFPPVKVNGSGMEDILDGILSPDENGNGWFNDLFGGLQGGVIKNQPSPRSAPIQPKGQASKSRQSWKTGKQISIEREGEPIAPAPVQQQIEPPPQQHPQQQPVKKEPAQGVQRVKDMFEKKEFTPRGRHQWDMNE